MEKTELKLKTIDIGYRIEAHVWKNRFVEAGFQTDHVII